jgi:hypothetical protein
MTWLSLHFRLLDGRAKNFASRIANQYRRAGEAIVRQIQISR